jgi:TonB family protein
MKKDENIDIKKYIDRVKEEMIKEGKLDKDNYIDEQHRLEAEMEKELSRPLPLKEEEKAGDSLSKAALEAAKYAGPTRVKYYLKDRYARHLDIPIYKCEDAGTVVLNIIVDREGRVISATVDNEKSAPGTCMRETALRSARKSYFNVAPGAPEKQSGTITFYFVPQG